MTLTRFFRLGPAVATAVLCSAPALACHHEHHHGISIAVGHLFLSLGHHDDCDEAPVAYAAPVVVAPLMLPPMVPAPPVVVEAPVTWAAPPLVMVVPPVVMAAPVAPVPVVAAPAPMPVEQPEPLQRLAVKWMPGFSSAVSLEGHPSLGPAALSQNFGLEVRLTRFFALRGDLEMRNNARNWDVPGLKLTLAPSARLHPFLSGGLSLGETAAAPGTLNVGFVGALGLDLVLFKYLFLTAEARYRSFPGDCCSLPRVSGLVGAGVSFL